MGCGLGGHNPASNILYAMPTLHLTTCTGLNSVPSKIPVYPEAWDVILSGYRVFADVTKVRDKMSSYCIRWSLNPAIVHETERGTQRRHSGGGGTGCSD